MPFKPKTVTSVSQPSSTSKEGANPSSTPAKSSPSKADEAHFHSDFSPFHWVPPGHGCGLADRILVIAFNQQGHVYVFKTFDGVIPLHDELEFSESVPVALRRIAQEQGCFYFEQSCHLGRVEFQHHSNTTLNKRVDLYAISVTEAPFVKQSQWQTRNTESLPLKESIWSASCINQALEWGRAHRSDFFNAWPLKPTLDLTLQTHSEPLVESSNPPSKKKTFKP